MRILIICTANSCRSQMAESFLKKIDPKLVVVSAGIHSAPAIHPKTIQVMAELGFDLSMKMPSDVNQFINEHWDFAITVCDDANQSCPTFNSTTTKRIHYRFIDPANAACAEEERLRLFRTVRDEVQEKMQEFYTDFIAKTQNSLNDQ